MVWREDDHHIPYDSISLALFRASRYGIKSIPTFLPLSRFFFPLQVSHICIHTSKYIVYPLLPAYIHVRPLFLSYNLINFFFFSFFFFSSPCKTKIKSVTTTEGYTDIRRSKNAIMKAIISAIILIGIYNLCVYESVKKTNQTNVVDCLDGNVKFRSRFTN